MAAALTAASSGASSAQALAPEQMHDRAVSVMRAVAGDRLPVGDTSVTWTEQGPILFHTASVGQGVVRSGFLRGDHMVGTAIVRWNEGAPASFVVLWTRDDSVLSRLHGAREGQALKLSGSRDTSLAIPAMPWAVADYGLEEQLGPLVMGLAADSTLLRVAVFRPFGVKWDTVGVTIRRREGAIVARVHGPGVADEVMVFTPDARLVWSERLDQRAERHPLEATERFPQYARLREALGTVR